MAVVEARVGLWEALAGRAPGQPVGPAEPGIWAAVVDRLNPTRARPVLRPGIERAELTSVRGVPYVMLRSPDTGDRACYLRLSMEEWRLAELMDGTRSVARLVAEFAKIAGRLAPDQVTRVVADLAGNRMLAELPVDAFHRLDRVHRRPWPVRLGRGVLAAARGRRMVLANVDPLVGFLYRAGGRVLFTRVVAVLLAVVAAAGLAVFGWTWWRGEQTLFLTGGSYATGAAVLLGLNVLALACHELGHALATKHAGRRVPAAGFLVYFGIPSVFVDTTDVWLAGRRARLVTTASGPAAGMILAGIAQLVGVFVPEAAPWTFKLAFAWYLNALFNLNPFLALDGYYLLMDWLEIPNLRTRGLAFVLGRLRRRPPAWGQLDREGRLVALYGTLAVLWLVVTVNLGWRIWTDRAAGLVTGLWRSGWPARLLLAVVLAALAAPLVYTLLGWLGRWLRRLRVGWVERRRRSDVPRRLDALRRSPLRELSDLALGGLAERARWVRPTTGQQLVFAGAAQPDLYVVADGAVEARRPGDPPGTVRQRVGAGGLVGLANALTGAPAALDWRTAGTTLLAIPASAVVAAVGPLPGPPPDDRADAEALFAEAPALGGLTDEDRMGLIGTVRRELLGPDAPVELGSPTEAIIVESGVIEAPDGTQLRRGTLIGPSGDGTPGQVATTRTPVRFWVLPTVEHLPALVGTGTGTGTAAVTGGPAGPAAPHAAPAAGLHPVVGYPPLAAPAAPVPPEVDDDIDRRFERKLWWLVLLLLLLALLTTATNLIPGPAWAEMPTDRALLVADRGRVEVDSGDRVLALTPGGRTYVGAGDQIRVGARSTARLTFRGGSVTLLCADTRAGIGSLWSAGDRPVVPHGQLLLDSGRLVADTTGTSRAFEPLALTVGQPGGLVTNRGAAWFAATGTGVDVATGEVRLAGEDRPAAGGSVGCGTGTPAPPVDPSTGDPGPSPGVEPSPTISLTPSPSPTPSASASSAGPPTTAPTRTPTRPPTRPPTSRPPTGPPPDRTGPTISGLFAKPTSITRPSCGPDGRSTIGGKVSDNVTPAGTVQVRASWSIGALGEGGTVSLSRDGGSFQGDVVVPYSRPNNPGATVTVTVRATDAAGNSTVGSLTINLEACGSIIG